MQSTENPQSHRAPEVEPPLRHTVSWRVSTVAIVADRRLRVTFIDGLEGEVDMKTFLADPKVDSTIFEPLRDPKIFVQAQVVLGAIEWPNGADLAPDTMYDAIRERGVWVLD